MSERIETATKKNREGRTTASGAHDEFLTQLPAQKGKRAREESRTDDRLRARAAMALGAVAFIVTVRGGFVLGPMIAVVTYAWLLRGFVTSRRRMDVIAAVVVTFLVGAGVLAARLEKDRAVGRQLAALRTEIDAYAKNTGSPPESLDDLGWRLYALFPGGKPVDPWGNAYAYRAPGTGGQRYDLWSKSVPAGDSAFNTVGEPKKPR